MNTKYFTIPLAIAIVILGFWLHHKSKTPGSTPPPPPASVVIESKTYASSTAGISFTYPGNYFPIERYGEIDIEHQTITLLEDDKPTSITIEIYKANRYSLPKGISITTSTIADHPASSWHWSGLYEGESTLIKTDKSTYVLSVSYLSMEDKIKQDFSQVLGTLRID